MKLLRFKEMNVIRLYFDFMDLCICMYKMEGMSEYGGKEYITEPNCKHFLVEALRFRPEFSIDIATTCTSLDLVI